MVHSDRMGVWSVYRAALLFAVLAVCRGDYYGKLLGEFERRGLTEADHHNVSGTVYVVDKDTLMVKGFTYDGKGPDAYFFIGTSGVPSPDGIIIPKAIGLGNEKLEAYDNEDLIIHLDPNVGSTNIADYVWLCVWCRVASANFADITIPADFSPPAEYSLGRLGLNPVVHQVTATDVIIVNSKQIRFEGLNYDGNGPDAYFWADTRDPPTSSGTRVPQVGESVASPLMDRLSGATMTVHLPSDLTVFTISNIGLWCVLARQNFGHVTIPSDLLERQEIVPFVDEDEQPQICANCEVLRDDEFHMGWTIDGDEIVICLSSRQPMGEYMSFGVSGSSTSTQMQGSDVVVAYIDAETSMPKVEDYYLEALAQCVRNTGAGVCPDSLPDVDGRGNNSVTLSGYFFQDSVTHITYRRPLAAEDAMYDKAISTTGSIFVSWALGQINEDGFPVYHQPEGRVDGDLEIDFGRESSSCPAFTTREDNTIDNAFEIEPIVAMEDTEFRCDIGQSGGRRGYQGITDNVGWGIAWYINGDLIPHITVRRNRTYTFKVYGGLDPAQSASYHPFYITTDEAGGYSQLPAASQAIHPILAGPVNGSYCIYEETSETPIADEASSYSAYRDTLELSCPDGQGSPGTLVWTPDADTPDLVYYQCYTHRYLGWQIKVTDDATKSVLSVITMVTTLLAAILLK